MRNREKVSIQRQPSVPRESIPRNPVESPTSENDSTDSKTDIVTKAPIVLRSQLAPSNTQPPRTAASKLPDIDAELSEARNNYAGELQASQQLVLDRYQEVINSLAAEGKLDDVLPIREEMRVFGAMGVMCGRPELRDAFISFRRRQNAAIVALSKTYERAVADYTKSLDFDSAQKTKSMMEQLDLPSRLISIQSFADRSTYVQHRDYMGVVGPVTTDAFQLNSTFELVEGLSDKNLVSFRSVNCPGFYICHGNFRLKLGRPVDSKEARENSTFNQVSGLADANMMSFEAVNWPGYFVRVRGEELWLDKRTDASDRKFREEATFMITGPRWNPD